MRFDKGQDEVGRNLQKTKAVAEPKTLRPDQVAVITGKSAEGTPGNASFSVEIGVVKHYNPDDEKSLQEDMGLGLIDHGGCIPQGENAGWIGIGNSALPKGQNIEIEVQKDRNVKLSIVDYYRGETKKESEVHISTLESMGFDCEQDNINNHGKKLSPELSQYLFEFATKNQVKRELVSKGLRILENKK